MSACPICGEPLAANGGPVRQSDGSIACRACAAAPPLDASTIAVDII